MFSIIFKFLFRKKINFALTSLGVVIGVLSLTLFIALSNGAKEAVIEKTEEKLPQMKQMHITTAYTRFSIGEIQKKILSDDIVEKIRKIDGVEIVSPKNNLVFPAMAYGVYKGEEFETDTGIFGINEGVIKDDIEKGVKFEDNENGVIPVIVSEGLADVVSNFLEANGYGLKKKVLGKDVGINKSKVARDVINGAEFTLELGKSSIADGDNVIEVKVKVVGLSEKVDLAGITMPLNSVKRFNKELSNSDENIDVYKDATVIIKDVKDLERIASKIEEMGFNVINEIRVIQQVIFSLEKVFLFLSILIILVALLGVVNVQIISVMEKRKDIAIFRVVGASRFDILKIFIGQSFFIGLFGAIIGVSFAYIVSIFLNGILKTAIEEKFSSDLLQILEVENIFYLSLETAIKIIIASAILSAISGIIPSMKASMTDPIKVLKEG